MRPLKKWDERPLDRSFSIPASLVLTTSFNAYVGVPNSSIYGAPKAALLSLARTLSGDLTPRGIRVNAIRRSMVE